MSHLNKKVNIVAGVRGIEPRSKVLETFILTAVLCPYNASLGNQGSQLPFDSIFGMGVNPDSKN